MPPVLRLFIVHAAGALPRPKAGAAAREWTQWNRWLRKATVWHASVSPEGYERLADHWKKPGPDDPWWTGVGIDAAEAVSLIQAYQRLLPAGSGQPRQDVAMLFDAADQYRFIIDDI